MAYGTAHGGDENPVVRVLDVETGELLPDTLSPYHNVVDGVSYPAMLITAGENDARVDPMHARKMVARLQAASAGDAPILLLVRGASGHGGGTTISTQIEQTADTQAFLMAQLGMETPG